MQRARIRCLERLDVRRQGELVLRRPLSSSGLVVSVIVADIPFHGSEVQLCPALFWPQVSFSDFQRPHL